METSIRDCQGWNPTYFIQACGRECHSEWSEESLALGS